VPTNLPRARGYLNPKRVIAISFWIAVACIAIAVVTSLLAIWQFTGTDVLWRTVATCVVVGIGTVAFAWINAMFAPPEG
jgi:branched-subunit amino acid ABC-type transport system permease component